MTCTTLSNPEALTRAKVRALAEGVQVLEVAGDPTRYICPSKSQPGVGYEVVVHTAEPLDLSCNCPAALHRRACKHRAAVTFRLSAQAEMQEADTVNGMSREEFERSIAELF